jgi:hypothetical protein
MAINVTIIENSWLAKIAAKKLKANNVAMVLGKNIHLHGCSKDDFLKNERWVRHEIAHVNQWLKWGKLRFTALYLFESFKKGYYNNKFEAEARNKECDTSILENIIIR